MSGGGQVAAVEQAVRERKEEHKAARREAVAERRSVAQSSSVCKQRRRTLAVVQRRRKGQQAAWKAAQHNLDWCRKKGWSTEGAKGRLSAARKRLVEKNRAETVASRELRNARSERATATKAAQLVNVRRDRARDRLKLEALRLRQARAAAASRVVGERRLKALQAKQETQRRELAARQREAAQQLEARLQEEASSLKRKTVEKARDETVKRQRRASAYSAALRSGEPLHADKFHRAGASAMKAKSDDPNYSNRQSVLRPRGKRHEFTIVYLHQFCLNGTNYVDWKPHYFFSQTKLPYLSLKVTLPTAKAIPITAHDGCKQYAWYDYKTDHDGKREDVLESKSLRETRDRIFGILDREIELLSGDASRVFLGGASQGCCTALHCALTYPRVLGGFVGVVGHLLSSSPLPKGKKNLPIYLYNGKADEVMRWTWVRETYKRFKEAGYTNVNIKAEEGVTHGKPERKEREWILDFLHQVIPKESKKG